jgi:hypothetical protein
MLYRVTYTNDIPEGFAGTARFWFIKIRPEYKDDTGLLQHEKEHVRQFWMFSLFHCLAYGRLDRYTLWCEVQAYRKQLEYSPGALEKYAGFLCEKYGLRLERDEAKRLLQ